MSRRSDFDLIFWVVVLAAMLAVAMVIFVVHSRSRLLQTAIDEDKSALVMSPPPTEPGRSGPSAS
jgi:hypothetical protein